MPVILCVNGLLPIWLPVLKEWAPGEEMNAAFPSNQFSPICELLLGQK